MNFNNTKKILSICAFTLTLIGCSSAPPNPLQNGSGFLPNYSLLKPVANPPQGTQIYTYKNPNVNRGSYTAVIVQPVQLYQTATSQGITDDQIAAAQANIQSGIQQIVSKKIAITTSPGPGIASLTVAITGAELQTEGFKPWNIVPISAAIKLASSATGTDSKTPILVVELKITDSVTGQLLRETVTVISGDTFRNKANTAQEFQQLAQTWVQQALAYSSK